METFIISLLQSKYGVYWTVRNILPVIASALLISIVLFTPASANTGEVLLSSGGSHSWSIELDRETWVSYEVEAEDGQTINLFLMSAADHQRFETGEAFTYMPDGSFIHVRAASADMVLLPGDYYLVAMAPDVADGASMKDILLSFNISVESTSASEGLKLIMGVGAAIILGLVGVIGLDVLYRNRRKGEGRP